jgi:hypothetical protein
MHTTTDYDLITALVHIFGGNAAIPVSGQSALNVLLYVTSCSLPPIIGLLILIYFKLRQISDALHQG